MANNGPPRPDIYWPPNSEMDRLKAEGDAADQSGDPARVAAVDAEAEYFMVQRHVWRVFNPGWVRPTRTIEELPNFVIEAPPSYNPVVHLIEADRMARRQSNRQSVTPSPLPSQQRPPPQPTSQQPLPPRISVPGFTPNPIPNNNGPFNGFNNGGFIQQAPPPLPPPPPPPPLPPQPAPSNTNTSGTKRKRESNANAGPPKQSIGGRPPQWTLSQNERKPIRREAVARHRDPRYTSLLIEQLSGERLAYFNDRLREYQQTPSDQWRNQEYRPQLPQPNPPPNPNHTRSQTGGRPSPIPPQRTTPTTLRRTPRADRTMGETSNNSGQLHQWHESTGRAAQSTQSPGPSQLGRHTNPTASHQQDRPPARTLPSANDRSNGLTAAFNATTQQQSTSHPNGNQSRNATASPSVQQTPMPAALASDAHDPPRVTYAPRPD